MQSAILLIHVLIAICLVALVLLQHGKGADVGATFGIGASNTMFGSAGATPFLTKMTIILAAIFFTTSIGLSYLASRQFEVSRKMLPLKTIPLRNFQLGIGGTHAH
ncbi:preprotein translocase subunit SecG [Coxiella endosymbiont of Amblyomma nuttalli]|uniref:preprotein translocase subunit SecG n=1 Tax=Coxiella endosymbiont of Amblyomma nuttalli TaxID=2749996 RepID=UPI001BA6F7F5|nr:preprotein translocase subunit SecG [Coxiella endosymbiont of Amblyomma nuttalli]QTS83666.1 Protein-export membrane protein SecG [Coxiella endosymbiont of Amblyomma nuttalli]